MADGATEKKTSYRYWVREASCDAAPRSVPRKLSVDDLSKQAQLPSNTLGSVWNQAGTWEEKNLNGWANDRIREMLKSVGSLDFVDGRADITEVSKCAGDAFLVTVRNKKRVGYTYELSLKFKGEWAVGGEARKEVKGHLDVAEFSFGELDDLELEVRISEEKGLDGQDKTRIRSDMKAFLPLIRDRLRLFEEELVHRS
ncbi:chaperone binding / ATPase activator [Wolffia australiana]